MRHIYPLLFSVSITFFILASNNKNVQRECFSEKQKACAKYIGIQTHTCVTVTTSKKILWHYGNNPKLVYLLQNKLHSFDTI